MTLRSPPWWKNTTVYQIYPRSFADGNGDGIGDLAGVISRLDYLHSLGVETLWLSPFYKSPQADFGYDISDHFDVAPEYGSLADCRRLIDEVHARGMKIVFDMVLNHTSDRHPWFLESRSARDNPMRDFYIWRDGPRPGRPPNNWKSMLGGSGWQWDEHSGQWYWASFLPFQPDLNWRNPAVKRAMLDVVRHWLREGADGLRLDIFNALFKDPSFSNNPFSLRPLPSEENPDGFFQKNLHTVNHPDTFEFARELRAVVDEFDHPRRFLVGEVFGSTPVLKRYCGEQNDGLHLVFLFKSMRTRYSARAFRELIREYEEAFPDPLHPTYVFANHDRPRALDRLGNDVDKAKLLAALQMTVRGVPFIYYGDEIGMEHQPVPRGEALDPVAHRFRFVPRWLHAPLRRFGILLNRDEVRRPMQWDDGRHAGFAPEHLPSTWLPVHSRARLVNVARQSGDRDSLLACYRRMLKLRNQSGALKAGRLELDDAKQIGELPSEVLSFRRVLDGKSGRETARVMLNFGGKPRSIDLKNELGSHASALHSNLHDEPRPLADRYAMAPHEAIVLLGRHSS